MRRPAADRARGACVLPLLPTLLLLLLLAAGWTRADSGPDSEPWTPIRPADQAPALVRHPSGEAGPRREDRNENEHAVSFPVAVRTTAAEGRSDFNAPPDANARGESTSAAHGGSETGPGSRQVALSGGGGGGGGDGGYQVSEASSGAGGGDGGGHGDGRSLRGQRTRGARARQIQQLLTQGAAGLAGAVGGGGGRPGRRAGHRLRSLFPLIVLIAARLGSLIPIGLTVVGAVVLMVAFAKKAFIVSLLTLALSVWERWAYHRRRPAPAPAPTAAPLPHYYYHHRAPVSYAPPRHTHGSALYSREAYEPAPSEQLYDYSQMYGHAAAYQHYQNYQHYGTPAGPDASDSSQLAQSVSWAPHPQSQYYQPPPPHQQLSAQSDYQQQQELYRKRLEQHQQQQQQYLNYRHNQQQHQQKAQKKVQKASPVITYPFPGSQR